MNDNRQFYELMPVASSDPESLLEDMDLYGCDSRRDGQSAGIRCERTTAQKPYNSDAEPRHRLGNDFEPDE
jgi:hypothetical protein